MTTKSEPLFGQEYFFYVGINTFFKPGCYSFSFTTPHAKSIGGGTGPRDMANTLVEMLKNNIKFGEKLPDKIRIQTSKRESGRLSYQDQYILNESLQELAFGQNLPSFEFLNFQ